MYINLNVYNTTIKKILSKNSRFHAKKKLEQLARKKDIISKTNNVRQLEGYVCLVWNSQVIHKGLKWEGKKTNYVYVLDILESYYAFMQSRK